MPSACLDDWLKRISKAYDQGQHHEAIKLGLERVQRVANQLCLLPEPPIKPTVITVAGTNGKGSTIAALEAFYVAAGYKVGAYTSPHLLRFHERIRIHGQEVSDQDLVEAFEAIEAACDPEELTYFEWSTLAAWFLFKKAGLEIYLLEVGMGGRLDAVNAMDPDVAIITSVALDHVQWLGADREAIGYEKTGIARSGRPLIYGEDNPPASLLAVKDSLGCLYYQVGQDFSFLWQHLPKPVLPLPSLACSLIALELLKEKFPVSREIIEKVWPLLKLPGRYQLLSLSQQIDTTINSTNSTTNSNNSTINLKKSLIESIEIRLDVAHNPAAATYLAEKIRLDIVKKSESAKNKNAENTDQSNHRRLLCVSSVLDDKDASGIFAAFENLASHWYLAPIEHSRGMKLEAMIKHLPQKSAYSSYPNLTAAFKGALSQAKKNDIILCFGSFYVVEAILREYT